MNPRVRRDTLREWTYIKNMDLTHIVRIAHETKFKVPSQTLLTSIKLQFALTTLGDDTNQPCLWVVAPVEDSSSCTHLPVDWAHLAVYGICNGTALLGDVSLCGRLAGHQACASLMVIGQVIEDLKAGWAVDIVSSTVTRVIPHWLMTSNPRQLPASGSFTSGMIPLPWKYMYTCTVHVKVHVR